MNDPEELFDICDPRGQPLGTTKARGQVHRDGDWHRAFHCWIVVPRLPGAPDLILQRRSDAKDTWPGRWDVSVAGHYSAGEGLEGGIREMKEELGLEVREEHLVHCGWRREEVFYENGLIEREIQDVFFLLSPVDAASLCPDPGEVSGVAYVPLAELPRLCQGKVPWLSAPGLTVSDRGGFMAGQVSVAGPDLVPRGGNYYEKVVRFAHRLARGQTPSRRRWL